MKIRKGAILTNLLTANICFCRNIFRVDSLVDISAMQNYSGIGISDLRSPFTEDLGHVCFQADANSR